MDPKLRSVPQELINSGSQAEIPVVIQPAEVIGVFIGTGKADQDFITVFILKGVHIVDRLPCSAFPA